MSDQPATRIRLRVVPNASRSEIIGRMDDGCLKVKVQAPPEGGRANKEVCELFAGALGVPRRAVAVVSGEKNRMKVLTVAGLSDAEVEELLGRVEG